MKQRIIKAAAALLEKCGAKFTVDDLADELSASKKTIYKYFESKEALAESVFDFICDSARASQKKIAAVGLNKKDKLIKSVLQYIKILQITADTHYGNYRVGDALYARYATAAERNFSEIAEEFSLQDAEYYKYLIDGLTKNAYGKKDRTPIYENCLRLIFCGLSEEQ